MQHPHFLLRNPTFIIGDKNPYCTDKIRHYGSTGTVCACVCVCVWGGGGGGVIMMSLSLMHMRTCTHTHCRYSTKHFNDGSTPKAIKDLFLYIIELSCHSNCIVHVRTLTPSHRHTSKSYFKSAKVSFHVHTTPHSSTMSSVSHPPTPVIPPTIIILSGDGLTTKHNHLPQDIDPISTHCPLNS